MCIKCKCETLIKLVYNSLLRIKSYHKPISVVYCDTGVENPVVTSYVYELFDKLKYEGELAGIPFKLEIVKPILDDRYFVKVIGRGYPPPTNIFRWCTDKLRIKPVNSIIDDTKKAIVLLGIRGGESEQRDRTILRHNTNDTYYLKQGSSKTKVIFSPIIEHDLEDVWITLRQNKYPECLDYHKIKDIYQDAESECYAFKDSTDEPCGKSRFGCWTCTVVRQDKSTSNMIKNGHKQLEVLFQFRNWLAEFRNNGAYRCDFRRNGQKGQGPITLEGRKIILDRLLNVQKLSNWELISIDEIEKINEYWSLDQSNKDYLATQPSN